MSSSDSSSAPSPSPPASPEASLHHEPPNLEQLVQHFVGAKRSLAATSHVWRANELVTSSRGLIEEIAVLNARNSFARGGVDEQLDTLHAIRDGVADVGEDAAAECTETLAALDEAHARLVKTLEALRKTVVDASLQRRGSLAVEEGDERDDLKNEDNAAKPEAPEQKTLYHFINERTHQDILAALRTLVDSYGAAQADLGRDLSHFDASLRTIVDVLAEGSSNVTGSSGPQDKRTLYDEPAPTIPHLFHGMEAHAAEMAKLLESLVRHYDLCVTALKHTEGGGAAAKQAVQAEHLSAHNSAGAEESLYRKTNNPEPLSGPERLQILHIVDSDAHELEDVVAEIRDHGADIEGMYEQLTQHAQTSRATQKSLRTTLAHLHAIHNTCLPTQLAASKTFRARWCTVQTAITEKTGELANLATFYQEFLACYGHVLREVERRRVGEAQMRKVAGKAQRELDRLFEADREARGEFMEEVRHGLPRDIWPGAGDAGARWEVRHAEGGG
ncbi:hypothetical protein LTR36_003937 [Oleoguttula mirabilis]|uniref:Autophagy-related protein 17 n=1 Tax=Oleoguttula mirabilis TaxID=1507867 RepID=A0AAV9JHK6_9PEZI|nr:hypothetical protein LTR36_003937 [Oleoguttula mirabilis]